MKQGQLVKRTYSLEKPFQVAQMATVLKRHIIKNKLYTPITTTNKRTGDKTTKNYVMVEGWQFAGGLLGLFPKVVEVKELGNGRWMAEVDIINQKTKEPVSTGFALCSKEESRKKTFDEYAILSMAQTRAIGKAYRNLIGWVMKIAGYESTPAEEMDKKYIKQESDKTETAKKVIKAQKNRKVLAQWRAKISRSRSYDKKDREELIKLIDKTVKGL